MKTFSTCFVCQDHQFSIGEVDADLIAVCVCPYGHKTIVKLSTHLCDTLYSSAVYAFSRDCLSESVMSFAAALERSFEMFTKITLHKEGITFNEIDNFWKELSSQSERQYGAFCSQFLKVLNKPWKADQRMTEFRNKVVHKGYIASTEEVTNYAKYITETLYKILRHLHKHFEQECRDLYAHEFSKSLKKYFELMKLHNAKSASLHSSLLHWAVDDDYEPNFLDAVQTMKRWNVKFNM